MTEFNQKVFDDFPLRPYLGNYNISKFQITNNKGEISDISDQLLSFDIYESLYDDCLTGQVFIRDTKNLIKNLPIICEETLDIIVDDSVVERRFSFSIFKISNRKFENFSSQSYILHICSKEMYTDSYKSVSKAYAQEYNEDAVIDILQNYLDSEKNLRISPTFNPQSFVIPNWKPFKAINWIARRSLSKNSKYHNSTFINFETSDSSFNFYSLDNLLNSDENIPYGTLKLTPSRQTNDGKFIGDSRNKYDALAFEQFEVVSDVDYLENSKNGLYANQNIVFDILNKNPNYLNFNYLENFYNSSHLNSLESVNSLPLCSQNNPAVDNPEACYDIIYKQHGLFSDENYISNAVETWIGGKRSKLHSLENFKIFGTLSGHFGLTVGMILNFEFPSADNIATKPIQSPDYKNSGQYLVTAIKHSFGDNIYKMHLEIVKDSFGQDPSNSVGFI